MKISLPDNYKYSLNKNNLLIETLVYDNRIKPIIIILLSALTGSKGRELCPPLLIEIVSDSDNKIVEVQVDRKMNVIDKPVTKL